MKKILLIVILLISSASTLISQREFSNWYFGQQSGITFNTPTSEPVFLPGNPSSQFEGVATISDANGQVLLSANGEYVFNRSGKVLNIGHPMMGHYSSTQAVIIVPKPGSKNLYYVFTSDAGEYTGEKNRGINYSIVDIDANDGEGAFVEINQNLLGLASEQLTAVYHPNRRDIWIVARGWKNNNFYAFLLTADGLSEPVITSIGFTRTSDNHTIGCLKFSPNGSYAAAPVYNEEFIELFKFDKNTGEFYDRLQINLPDMINLYGVEFSPNGEMLYVTNSRDELGYGSLLQLDVSNYNKSAIENSIQIIYQNNIHLGTIQIGPNRKIYLAILNSKFLMCVLKPDLRGDESGFNLGLVALNDSLSQLGLPQFTGFWSEDKELMICEEEDLILDPDDFLHDTIYIDIDYEWTGPNGFTSKSPIAIKENIQLADSGDYVLSAVYKYQDTQVVTSKMIKVRVGKKFKFSISGKDSICTGEFTLLEPDTVDNRFQYRWNTGHNSSSLVVRSTGLYKLYISNSYGCTDSAEFFVNVIDKPHAKIEGEKLICLNSSVELKSEETDPELKYLWSTGDTTQSITVDTSGIYELTVSNGLGCFSTDEFEVYYYPDMALEIIGDTVWCSFTPAKLTASVTPYHDSLHYDFVWSNGVTGKDITVNKTGELSVIVTVEGRCVFYDTIFVIKSTPPRLEVDITEQRTFCDNETLVVDLIDPEPEVNYYWEDTELPEFPRIISETGKYKIMALTKEGCKDEFEFEVEFLETPEAQILFTDTVNFCNLDSLTLEAYPKGEGYNYLWLNNEKREEYLTVYESGVYSLVVTNELGCSDTAYIEVNLGAGLPVRISGRVNACIGDSITLTARVGIVENLDDFNFLWSNGETTNSISVNTGGSYNVIVEHSSGCIGYDTVKVNFFEVPKLEFDFDRTVIICEDEEFEAKPKEINPAYLYSWSDGTFNVPKTFRESGVYTLYAMNAGQCTDSIEFELIVRNSPLANIVQDSPLKLCPGDSLFIGVETDSEDNNILWSNGETNDNISVDKPGVYHVTVTSPDACVST
ncbi:MAG: hypothetical protein RBT61_07235, partial [Candidatus Kapabacteria bacterium]|nr:hypothetical protein [Candidatus Kapabacteria bacterium]